MSINLVDILVRMTAALLKPLRTFLHIQAPRFTRHDWSTFIDHYCYYHHHHQHHYHYIIIILSRFQGDCIIMINHAALRTCATTYLLAIVILITITMTITITCHPNHRCTRHQLGQIAKSLNPLLYNSTLQQLARSMLAMMIMMFTL